MLQTQRLILKNAAVFDTGTLPLGFKLHVAASGTLRMCNIVIFGGNSTFPFCYDLILLTDANVKTLFLTLPPLNDDTAQYDWHFTTCHNKQGSKN